MAHRGDDRCGLFVDPFGGGGAPLASGAVPGDFGDEPAELALAADDFDGFGSPGVALLGQGARFVFCLAGFQGGLLGDGQHFHGGGFAAVLGLKRLGQLADAVLDGAAPRGPALDQFGGHAGDFTHRALAGCGGSRRLRMRRRPRDQVGFQAGVVQLGGGHRGFVQRGAVQGQPARDSVGAEGSHFVAHRDVGVQVGVPGARVAVVERGGDQTGGVDLGDAVGAHAGERRVVFEEGQRFGDGFVVAVLDGCAIASAGPAPTAPRRISPG